jgi:chromosome segregation ATPase
MIDRISTIETVLVNESGDVVCAIEDYAVVREVDLAALESAVSETMLLRSQKRDLDKMKVQDGNHIASLTNRVTALQQELHDLDAHATNVERARAVAEEQLRAARDCIARKTQERTRAHERIMSLLNELSSARRAFCSIAYTAERLVQDGLSPKLTAIQLRDKALRALDADHEEALAVLRGENI